MTDPHEIRLGPGRLLLQVENNAGELCGFIDSHPRKDDPSKSCGGSVALVGKGWATPGRGWTMTGTWPKITLEPSLLCTACGDHGYVRDGAWVEV